MKKGIVSFIITLVFINWVSAQAYEGTTEFKKKKRNAIIIEYAYPPEAVENAFDEKMAKLGYRGKEEKGLFNGDKGFKVYSKAYITDISDNAIDYIIRIDRKSKKEDDKSILYLITMQGDADQSTVLNQDGIDKAKSFLNNFTPNIESANLDIKIKEQEEIVAKSEKKLKKLQEDQSDMEGKVKKLQDSLKDNAKDQEGAVKEIENMKLALENLRGQRKMM